MDVAVWLVGCELGWDLWIGYIAKPQQYPPYMTKMIRHSGKTFGTHGEVSPSAHWIAIPYFCHQSSQFFLLSNKVAQGLQGQDLPKAYLNKNNNNDRKSKL